MKKILIIKSSMTDEQSKSNKIADWFIDKATSQRKDIEINVLDLSKSELGQTIGLKNRVPYEQAIKQFVSCDALVVFSPLYYYSISPLLKNWIDKICQNNVTYKMSEFGDFETLWNKNYLLFSVRGGFYTNNSRQYRPFDLEYLNEIIGNYLGGKKVGEFIIEGLNVKDIKTMNPYETIDKWIFKNDKKVEALIDLL